MGAAVLLRGRLDGRGERHGSVRWPRDDVLRLRRSWRQRRVSMARRRWRQAPPLWRLRRVERSRRDGDRHGLRSHRSAKVGVAPARRRSPAVHRADEHCGLRRADQLEQLLRVRPNHAPAGAPCWARQVRAVLERQPPPVEQVAERRERGVHQRVVLRPAAAGLAAVAKGVGRELVREPRFWMDATANNLVVGCEPRVEDLEPDEEEEAGGGEGEGDGAE